jgi:hypothetical protein
VESLLRARQGQPNTSTSADHAEPSGANATRPPTTQPPQLKRYLNE